MGTVWLVIGAVLTGFAASGILGQDHDLRKAGSTDTRSDRITCGLRLEESGCAVEFKPVERSMEIRIRGKTGLAFYEELQPTACCGWHAV